MNSTARRTSPLIPVLVVTIVLGFVAGLGLVIWGGSQKSRLNLQYKVQFLSEGDTCTDSLPLHLDVKSGEPMDCTSMKFGLVADVDLPGFSDTETEQVLALATSLADGELSKDEQRQIQTEVDRIAAGKPEKVHYSGLWGSGLQFVGLGFFGLGLVGGLALFLVLRSRKRRAARAAPPPGIGV